MSEVPGVALVAAGGAVGAVARHLVAVAVETDAIEFPLGTLTVNVLGSFALGLVTFFPVGGAAALFVGTGACGAFTTFSSFSVATLTLTQRGERTRAALFVAANTLLAVGAVAAAWTLVDALGP